MNELANTSNNALSRIDELAMQARALRVSINVNMWQLARVFIEAKAMVSHGGWEKWLKDNAEVSVRTAEDMIASYKRFGGRAPYEGLSPSQTFKLLPLPDGTEEKFMQAHDVKNMSTREIQEAVKQARAEAQAEIDQMQLRIDELESREPEIPDEVIDELKQSRAEIARLSEAARETLEDANQLRQERAALERDRQEQEELLKEQQEALNKAQEELLNLQSAQARGDAAREPSGELTLGVFSAAVGEFMGLCARMPYMGASFATMPQKTKNAYDELLSTIEGWTQKAREALESYVLEEA